MTGRAMGTHRCAAGAAAGPAHACTCTPALSAPFFSVGMTSCRPSKDTPTALYCSRGTSCSSQRRLDSTPGSPAGGGEPPGGPCRCCCRCCCCDAWVGAPDGCGWRGVMPAWECDMCELPYTHRGSRMLEQHWPAHLNSDPPVLPLDRRLPLPPGGGAAAGLPAAAWRSPLAARPAAWVSLGRQALREHGLRAEARLAVALSTGSGQGLAWRDQTFCRVRW